RGEHAVAEHRGIAGGAREVLVVMDRVEVARGAGVAHQVGAREVLDHEGRNRRPLGEAIAHASLLHGVGRLDGGVPHVGHDLAVLVAELRLADDERHGAATPSLLLEHLARARPEAEHVTGTDRPDVLEFLLAVQETAIVELHRAAGLAQVAHPVRDRHQERGGREGGLVVQVRRVRILHRAGELADLPALDPHHGLGAPHLEQAAIDLGHRPAYRLMCCATSSRFQVASPKVTSELFARLKKMCMSCSHVNPMPPWIWMPSPETWRYASEQYALAIAAASGASVASFATAHAA